MLIEKIVASLTGQMVSEKLVSEEMEEQYKYVLTGRIEHLVVLVSIAVIGLAAHILLPTVLFLATFWTLRARTGGFHLKRFGTCYLASLGCYCGILAMFGVLLPHIKAMGVVLIVSTLLIEVIGTINHPNMHMDARELAASRKMARIMALADCGIIAVLFQYEATAAIATFMTMAVTLCAILMCIAKILGQEVCENGEG